MSGLRPIGCAVAIARTRCPVDLGDLRLLIYPAAHLYHGRHNRSQDWREGRDPAVWQWLCELSARIRSSRVRYTCAESRDRGGLIDQSKARGAWLPARRLRSSASSTVRLSTAPCFRPCAPTAVHCNCGVFQLRGCFHGVYDAQNTGEILGTPPTRAAVFWNPPQSSTPLIISPT